MRTMPLRCHASLAHLVSSQMSGSVTTSYCRDSGRKSIANASRYKVNGSIIRKTGRALSPARAGWGPAAGGVRSASMWSGVELVPLSAAVSPHRSSSAVPAIRVPPVAPCSRMSSPPGRGMHSFKRFVTVSPSIGSLSRSHPASHHSFKVRSTRECNLTREEQEDQSRAVGRALPPLAEPREAPWTYKWPMRGLPTLEQGGSGFPSMAFEGCTTSSGVQAARAAAKR